MIHASDLPTTALEKQNCDLSVTNSLKVAVHRHQRANDREHKRRSAAELRSTIRTANPALPAERVEEILRNQLKATTSVANRVARHPSARDIERDRRKAGVKARKGARR